MRLHARCWMWHMKQVNSCLNLFLESLKYASGLIWSRRNVDGWPPILTPWFILFLFTEDTRQIKNGVVADISFGMCSAGTAVSQNCLSFVFSLCRWYMWLLLSGWPLLSSLSETGVSAWWLLAPRWYLVPRWEKGKLQTQPLEILLLIVDACSKVATIFSPLMLESDRVAVSFECVIIDALAGK